MTYVIRPKLPEAATFTGQIVFNTTDLEVDDRLITHIESVDYGIFPQFLIKNTGFEKKKYKYTDKSTVNISITLVGNLPFWLHQILIQLATAVNGSGMIIQFNDTFVSGTTSAPTVYDCRWLNAGDFVENNELLNGGVIELGAFTMPEDEGGLPTGDFEKTIEAPASGYEWDMKINDVDAETVYYRVP